MKKNKKKPKSYDHHPFNPPPPGLAVVKDSIFFKGEEKEKLSCNFSKIVFVLLVVYYPHQSGDSVYAVYAGF